MWSLKYNGVTKTLAEWGLCRLKRTLSSLDADTASLLHPRAAATDDPLFAFGGLVEIYRDAALWFTARARNPRAKMEGGQEYLEYQLVGPWQDLEDCAFQQLWNVTDGVTTSLTPTNKSRVILNQDDTGARTNTAQQITAALNYAISCGANLQVGTIGVNAIVPFSQAVDLTCAEIIRAMLQWTPDAVGWFDYSATPPRFHVTRRADAAVVSLPLFSVRNAKELDLEARHDLVLPCVVLKYERTNSVNDNAWTTLDVDKYPSGANETQLRALVSTIPLSGFTETWQSQPVVVDPIQKDSATWWKRMMPTLQKPDSLTEADEDLTITDAELDPGPDGWPAGKNEDSYPNRLIGGAVPAWENPNLAKQFTVRANLTVTYRWKDILAVPLALRGTIRERVVKRPLSVNVVGTSLISTTYSDLSSSTPAEDLPVGLAQQIYSAVSTLHYDGVFTRIEAEVSSGVRVGHNVNLTGGKAAWATMAAQVQQVTEDVDAGETEIEIGPPKHLGVEDLVSLMMANRARRAAIARSERFTAQPEGRAAVEGTLASVPTSSSLQTGLARDEIPVGSYKIVADRSKTSITELFNDVELSFRTLVYYVNGSPKRIAVLASADFNAPDATDWLAAAFATVNGLIAGVATTAADAIDKAEDVAEDLANALDPENIGSIANQLAGALDQLDPEVPGSLAAQAASMATQLTDLQSALDPETEGSLAARVAALEALLSSVHDIVLLGADGQDYNIRVIDSSTATDNREEVEWCEAGSTVTRKIRTWPSS